MGDDANWPRASAWLAGAHHESVAATLAIAGAPLRLGSITPGRCDLAPKAIRDAFYRFSTYDFDTGVDIREVAAADLGDLPLADLSPEQAMAPLSAEVGTALRQYDAAVLLGGDNSITRPGVHGLGVPLEQCALLTIDAHLDLRSLENGLSNGNPVRALLRDGLPGNQIAQIGIQSFANSPAYAAVARDAGIRIVTADSVRAQKIDAVINESLAMLASRAEVIYVDLDLDVMDRMFAPATPGSRPGGLTPAEIRRAAYLCGSHPRVRVLDLVEMDPTQDIAQVTALTAAACVLSFASGVAQRRKAKSL